MDPWLRENLVCPRDHGELDLQGDTLVCSSGHRYPVVDGIPIMLLTEVEQTHPVADVSLAATEEQAHAGAPIPADGTSEGEIDPLVQEIVGATSGHLYLPLINKLSRYPIPDIRLPPGRGETLLDLGCNWGRWCVAAARKGYNPVGIDPSLAGIVAARKVSRQLGVTAHFVVADARYLPFRPRTFDVVFSYSVLQHLSKDNVRVALGEVARVLRPGGTSLIQMAHRVGVRSLYHQAKRRFREPREFEVRYWSVPELRSTFSGIIGASSFSVDGYFGLGIQKADVDLLPFRYRLVVNSSELLRAVSKRIPWMTRFADSLYVASVRRADATAHQAGTGPCGKVGSADPRSRGASS